MPICEYIFTYVDMCVHVCVRMSCVVCWEQESGEISISNPKVASCELLSWE